MQRWPQNPAWRFAAVGVGHDVPYWTEHEDADFSRLDGLALAADKLLAAAGKL